MLAVSTATSPGDGTPKGTHATAFARGPVPMPRGTPVRRVILGYQAR